MSRGSSEFKFWAVTCAMILAWVLFHLGPLIGCLGECYVDLETLHGRPRGLLELDDTRLNTWILAWTQRALILPGISLFDPNAFHPASGALAGSEHLLGQALIGLPLRILSDNAVLLYGSILVASYVLLGLSTLVFTRWLTDSRALSLGAALVAMAMPWREAELSHLQLLSASAFPLIFLFTLRLLLGQGKRWDTLGLTVVLTLQLLSSYYLVYLITFSLAITTVVAISMRGIDFSSTLKLASAALIPYGILTLVSIPYLERAARGELAVSLDPENPIPGDHLANALAMLSPRLNTLWQQNPGFEPGLFIPLGVLVLALLAPAWFLTSQRHPLDEATSNRRVAVVALVLCCAFAFVMTLGSHLPIGTSTLRLPGYWASLHVPGFANLRAPHRWAIVIGTLMPVLAALGGAWLTRFGRNLRIPVAGLEGRSLILGTVGLLVALNLPWTRLPIRPAFDGPSADATLYEQLSRLPDGPVLEIPWHPDSTSRTAADTRYMLASTQHWRPLLNGFTGHEPAPSALLNRIAQNLPAGPAVERLARLAGPRWVVVHWKGLGPGGRGVWKGAAEGGLIEVYQDNRGAIFEFPQIPENGLFTKALLDTDPRPLTLAGLSRAPLQLREGEGTIVAFETVDTFRYMGAQALRRPLRIQIENRSGFTWPGLDIQTEGLVQLRYAFSTLDDRVIESGLAPLDADVAPGLHWVHPVIGGPLVAGRYRLCADLVQTLGTELSPLPVPPVENLVEVTGVGARRDDPMQRLALAYREQRRDRSAPPPSRCARERTHPEELGEP